MTENKLYKKLFLDFEKGFKKLKIRQKDNIYIVSNLKKLGRLKLNKNKKTEAIFNSLKKTLSKNGTIFSPSASMNLINTKEIFDLKKTKSNNMGPLAEFIRKKSKFRSLHPYWSISGIGKNSKILKNCSNHSYATGSPWSEFIKLNTKQINIGIHPSKAVTLIHHIETICGVPYRYNKEFNHNIQIGKHIKEKKFYMSVRFKNSDIVKKKRLNEHFFAKLKKLKKLNEINVGYGIKMWSFQMIDFYEIAINFFKKDIYNYLEKEPKIKPYKNL